MNKIVAVLSGSLFASCVASWLATSSAGADVQVVTRLWPVGWSADGQAALFQFEEQHDDRQLAGFRLLPMHSDERIDVVLSDRHIGRQVLSAAHCRKALREFAPSLAQHGFGGVKVRPDACAGKRSRALAFEMSP